MPKRYRRSDLHEHILAVMDEMSEDDPFEAVRKKAQAVVAQYASAFEEVPPFNVTAVASMRGLHWSNDDPRFSPDSEIAPEADGRVVLRVNKNRPATRQRFSICHEIGHTLFPEYQLAVRCRKGANRSFADATDLIETLCDAAASELMFPVPWFSGRIATMIITAASVAELASDYQASRDATARRLVELHPEPLAAVFLSWKFKPTEIRAAKRHSAERLLFSDMTPETPKPLLRVDYAITNAQFENQFADHIPKDKSVANEGPIYLASITQTLQDGVADLNLGTLQGQFNISALPIFTSADALGPNDASSVVAILTAVG